MTIMVCGICGKRTRTSEGDSVGIWACHSCRRLTPEDRYERLREAEYQEAKYPL